MPTVTALKISESDMMDIWYLPQTDEYRVNLFTTKYYAEPDDLEELIMTTMVDFLYHRREGKTRVMTRVRK